MHRSKASFQKYSSVLGYILLSDGWSGKPFQRKLRSLSWNTWYTERILRTFYSISWNGIENSFFLRLLPSSVSKHGINILCSWIVKTHIKLYLDHVQRRKENAWSWRGWKWPWFFTNINVWWHLLTADTAVVNDLRKCTRMGQIRKLTLQHPNQSHNRNNHLPRAPPFGAGAVCNPHSNPCERDETGDRGWILPSFWSVTALSYTEQTVGCNKGECARICGESGLTAG